MSRNQAPQLMAGGDINPSRFVKQSTAADNTALQAGANDPIIGISQVGTVDPPGVTGASTLAASSGLNLEIFGFGDIALLTAGTGGYTHGDNLASDANGKGVTATSGQNIGAVALESAAAGEAGRVVVVRYKTGAGYGVGDGGAVTQITSSATGVTLNKATGQITTVALTTAAAAEERFTVTNSTVAATDTVVLSSTYNGAGTPAFAVTNVTAGTFDIIVTNLHASAAFNAAMTINFAVVKGSAT